MCNTGMKDQLGTDRAGRIRMHLTGLCSEGRCAIASPETRKAGTAPQVNCFSGSNADAANSSSSVRKPELALLPPHAHASKQMHPCGVHQLSSVDPPLLTYPAKDSFTDSAPRVIKRTPPQRQASFFPRQS